jgi:hypothetical protein
MLNDKYRLILEVSNPQAEDHSISQMNILATFDGVPCAESPPVVLYSVQDDVTVDTAGNIRDGSAQLETGPLAGSRVPTSGLINYGCGQNQIQISFYPAGALLAANSTTHTVVDIPVRWTSTTHYTIPGKPPERGMATEGPTIPTTFVAFRVTAQTDTNMVDSCFIYSRAGDGGPRPCDQEIAIRSPSSGARYLMTTMQALTIMRIESSLSVRRRM